MSSFLPAEFSAAALEVHWRPREKPLAPVAVAARGFAALRLAQRLLAEDELLERFEGVAGRELLVLQPNALQPCTDLPWVDGVQYLGKDPRSEERRVGKECRGR